MQMMPESMTLAEPMKIEYPVAKTFIQYPALRNPSLEAFFKDREAQSCPASRMASIDEVDEAAEATDAAWAPNDISSSFFAASKEAEYTVKNTFIDLPAWEPLRNLSLEGFFHERELQSCPATRVHSLDDSLEIDVEKQTGDVEHPALRSISLEEYLRDLEVKYQNMEEYDEISTKANTEEDTAPPTPEILSDSEEEAKPVISLSSSLGLWSVGSAGHSYGNCKPCAFLWKYASGCQSGTNCEFCHLCPAGEKKRRKKDKLVRRKMMLNFQQQQQQQATGYYGMF